MNILNRILFVDLIQSHLTWHRLIRIWIQRIVWMLMMIEFAVEILNRPALNIAQIFAYGSLLFKQQCHLPLHFTLCLIWNSINRPRLLQERRLLNSWRFCSICVCDGECVSISFGRASGIHTYLVFLSGRSVLATSAKWVLLAMESINLCWEIHVRFTSHLICVLIYFPIDIIYLCLDWD